MSAVRSFKTAPPVGSDVSYKFIAYGDMGLLPAAHSTAKYVAKDVQDADYEFIFHNGDISYARGYVSQRLAWVADGFFLSLGEPSATQAS